MSDATILTAEALAALINSLGQSTTIADGSITTPKIADGAVTSGKIDPALLATFGNMVKSVYDTDNDGVVDAAETVPWSGITGKPTTVAGAGLTDALTVSGGTLNAGAILTGTFVGKLNGILYTVSSVAPSSPSANDIWFDLASLAIRRYNLATDLWQIMGGVGGADMLKSVYDTNSDGTVDVAANALKVNGNKHTVSAAAPTGNVTDDIWYDTTAKEVKRWTGTVWDTISGTSGAPSTGDMLKSVYDADNDGIVDAAESVAWVGITGKPTTVSGIGLTDAVTTAGGQTLGGNITATDFLGKLNGVRYTVAAAAPTSPTPATNDMWVDTVNNAFKRWSGSAWITVGAGGGGSATIPGVANVRDYGATGDGTTNDVAGVKAALDFLISIGGGTLLFPKGTYNLAAWTVYTVTVPLTITGYGEHSLLVGPKGAGIAQFMIVRANFACENISIDGFLDVFDFTSNTTMLGHIRIYNVRFTDYTRATVKWLETNLNGGCQRIYIENCRMLGINSTPQYGLNLSTPMFQKLEIHGNTVDNITDRGFYIGSATLSLQDSRESVNISRNNVGNIYNPSTTTSEGSRAADGIQVMATNAVITDNYIYEIDNYAKQDCEGIYTKCKFAIIARNHLLNAGGGEAFIDIKGAGRAQSVMANCTNQTNVTTLTVTNLIYGLSVGGLIDIVDSTNKNPDGTDVVKIARRKVTAINTAAQTIAISGTAVTTVSTDYIQKSGSAKGYGVLCFNNTLVDGRPYGDLIPETGLPYNTLGIKINNDDVKVEGNLLEGFTYGAISVGGSSYSNVDIRGNKIRKIRGQNGISLGGLGRNFVVDNNQISEITGESTTGTPSGISVGGTPTDIIISNNQIDSVKQNGVYTSTNGISIGPGTIDSTKNITVKNNNIKTVGRGISFRVAPVDDIWIYGNKIQDTPTPIFYSTFAPTNLVMGTNNPTLALPTPIDPSTIAGLSAWFDAPAITGLADGAAVASWADKSATNIPLVQATGASQPTYVASGLNGKAVVAFNGAQNMKTATWAAAIAQPFTLFVVARLDAAYLFDGLSAGNRVWLRNNGGLYYFNAGVTLSSYPTASDTNYHVFTLRANGTGVQGGIKVDASSVTGDVSGASPQPLNGLTLGSLYSNGSYATGRVGEILLYNSNISAYNAAQIEYYLKSKWAVGG